MNRRQVLFDQYLRANAFINEGLIRRDASAPGNQSSERTRRQWMESFLPDLGDPQEAFGAVHVAGTSGKGSVCAMIAEILHAAGVHVGMHLSPYVQVATEKLWVDGVLASTEQYGELMEWIRPRAEARRGPEVPMHGMASVGLFLEHFRRERVEIGVVEVGVGGRNDLTNVLRTEVAVVTNVGLDHLKTLGPTLEDIAAHKAGIIKAGCRAVVFAPADNDPALLAARRRASEVGATLRVVEPEAFGATVDAQGYPRLHYRSYRFDLEDLQLALRGPFQAANAALAVAACEELDAEGGRITEQAIRQGLAKARLPARLELMPRSSASQCAVLIDGAHNPDKLAGALAGLSALPARRLHLLYGALSAKSVGGALEQAAGRAASITLAEPQVYAKAARPAHELASELRSATNAEIAVVPDARAALQQILATADANDLLLVTGSLYLAGEVRGHFFDDAAILEQRTPWPTPDAA